MSKKRKRVHKIMQLTEDCSQKVKDGIPNVNIEYEINQWDIDCLADYFFMEYYPGYDKTEYYKNSVKLSVEYHKRVCRAKSFSKIDSISIDYESYVIYKYSRVFDTYLEVYRTLDMNELAGILQLFNDHPSIAWWVYYEDFITSFQSIIGVTQ